MAFKTGDFKKTTRAGVLYPYQIKDDRFTASIGYAIAYYERMLGRRRGEFEADALLEFFGDPRLARGLVACLGRTYIWRQQSFAEVIGAGPAADMRRWGLATPQALRAQLYRQANAHFGGVVLPAQRAQALEQLCAELPLTPEQAEALLTLDDNGQALLTRVAPTPDPASIVALYNYHSLETALRHAGELRLRLRGPVWTIVRSTHNLARRYNVRYELSRAPRSLFDQELELTLYGALSAGAPGGLALQGRGASQRGRRMAQVLLRLLAAHPDSLSEGEAQVSMGEKACALKLDERALRILGVEAQAQPAWGDEAWDADLPAAFQKAWSRAYLRGRTAGWRLRRDPEPLVGAKTVVVPDFICLRGSQRVPLCLATGRATVEALARDLAALGPQSNALLLGPARWGAALRSSGVPAAAYSGTPTDGLEAVVATLERCYPRPSGRVLTPWQRLERQVAEDGFVPEEQVATLLGCPPDDVARTVQRWGGPQLHHLSGLGVCAPELLPELRRLLEEGEVEGRRAA
jgi:predicted nuclease of restriction endonuclease-like RecB superfamily